MRCLVLLLITIGLTRAARWDPSNEELLDSVALSEESIARFRPKNIENVNEKMRQFIVGIVKFDEICRGTAKPNLCSNALKRPLLSLKKTFNSLFKSEDILTEIGSSSNRTKEEIDLEKAIEAVKSALIQFSVDKTYNLSSEEAAEFGQMVETLAQLEAMTNMLNNIMNARLQSVMKHA